MKKENQHRTIAIIGLFQQRNDTVMDLEKLCNLLAANIS
jgi:hypothetical protein